MSDAWTILKNNSTESSGDAWIHLNNQAGGETVYIEVPTSGLQGGRVMKNIVVTAKIKMRRRRKKFKVFAKLINI